MLRIAKQQVIRAYNKNSNMNQTWRDPPEQETMRVNASQPRYTRYDMSFRPREGQTSLNDLKCEKPKNRQNMLKSRSLNNHENSHTFTRYSFFPAHCTRPKEHSILNESITKNEETLKWVGVKQISQIEVDRSFCNRNAFPQRKTKGSDQLIINMLMKYEKHYGRPNDDTISPLNLQKQEAITPKYLSKREKKFKTRIKWFRAQEKTIK